MVAFDVPLKGTAQKQPAFTVSVGDNDPRTSLLQWFSQNVDSSNRLIDSNTYILLTLPDGTQALIAAGAPPLDWTGGPTGAAYVMAPDNRHYAVLQVASDNPLFTYGISDISFITIVPLVAQSIRFQ